jgi:hypothetical protein
MMILRPLKNIRNGWKMKAFILNLINDPYTIEQNFKPEDYDLVFIGFRMSIMDGFDLYNKLYEMSKYNKTHHH